MSLFKQLNFTKKITRSIRFFIQRRIRGWDDSDTWNLDGEIAKFTIVRLKRFKEVNNGFPGHDTTKEGWDEIIDKMIFALDKISKWDDKDNGDSTWDKEDQEKINEGLELFGKYFRDLWW